MRITMAQLNPVVGSIDENVSAIVRTLDKAARDKADLVVFSELIITGYPPKDLLERPAFIDQAEAGLHTIERASQNYSGMGIVLGCPVRTGLQDGKPLYNSAILISEGRVLFKQPKMLLPTYDVFDEARYFTPASENKTFTFKGVKLGLSICEDLWFEPDPWNRRPYACDPIDLLAKKGAALIVNISASPFSIGKEKARHELIRNHTKRHGTPFVFVNQVGGNDSLVFDGRSLYVDEAGQARSVFPTFREDVRTIDTNAGGTEEPYRYEDELETICDALVLGTRDYLRKCGIAKAVIGLSGGIDSAVTAAIAHQAVGADNVVAIAMPSRYSSSASLDDAKALAANLAIKLEVIPITSVMDAYDRALDDVFKNNQRDVTEENIQARIRGNCLMAYSNKFGHLPLSTGNKSELAVGYCTLYGDMSGGLAVISDVPKTLVYKLAELINQKENVIPRRTMQRAPSAELKPDQKDQDVLPPYEILDQILECHIDLHLSHDRIVEKGFDAKTVAWVIDTVRKNEYKRKQAAPGIKVTSKAFGTGRRMPIAARYDA
ncbi:MAG: NAD+ synthase [Candidatus Krumholzibacteria bacterium]|nr:NAD+ synthase [Candidatus Krumholzibacteria bacterium]